MEDAFTGLALAYIRKCLAVEQYYNFKIFLIVNINPEKQEELQISSTI